MTYKMTLTEKQYNYIALCVEVCDRISCGQIQELNQILPGKLSDWILEEIKQEAFPELSKYESYGWNGGYRSVDHGEEFRETFDKFQAQGYQIYREMLHQRNMAKGIDNVYSSPTLTTNKAQPPIIECVNDERDNV